MCSSNRTPNGNTLQEDTGSEIENRENKEWALTRTGCKALIELKKHNDEKWVVAKFEDHHNHELVSPSKVQYLKSNRRVGDLYGKKTC